MNDVLAAYGIPLCEEEYRLHPTRRWRFDYAWPDHKIALEVEGGVFTRGRHTRGKGFLGDIAKYNEATRLGWRVFRCTPQQMKTGEIFDWLKEVFDGH